MSTLKEVVRILLIICSVVAVVLISAAFITAVIILSLFLLFGVFPSILGFGTIIDDIIIGYAKWIKWIVFGVSCAVIAYGYKNNIKEYFKNKETYKISYFIGIIFIISMILIYSRYNI